MSANGWREIADGVTNDVRWRIERREHDGPHPSEYRVTSPPGAFPVAIVHAAHADVVVAALRAAGTGEGEIVGWRVSAILGGTREYTQRNNLGGCTEDVSDAEVFTERADAVENLRSWKRTGRSWHTFRLHPVRRRGGKR